MARLLTTTLTVTLCLLAGAVVSAQVGSSEEVGAPAHVAVVSGSATIERNGVGEPAVENMPLLQGDRLRTESGRVEILLPDGSVLDVDRHSTVDLLAGGLIRLMGGRIIFVLSAPPGEDVRRDYQVDAPAGSVRFTHAGEYRVSTQVTDGLPFLDVSVVRGRAVVDADGRSVPLSAGERAQAAQGQGVTAVGTFNSAVADAFIEWAEGLRGQRVGTQSNAYLPPELQVYGGTFDRDGSWDQSADYGWVWYPRVAADWRPYYDGGWYPYGWGWTWVGPGSWAWPTHHYGRWGHGHRGWYWIPSAGWGPAWVSWGFSTGYVSWCPLGWNNSPVFGFSFGVSFGYASPWLGWTVVPHHAFAGGHGYRVHPYALHGDHLRAVERTHFNVGPHGPPVPGEAVGRGNGGRVTPYDRAGAVAAQRVGRNPGWGQEAATLPRAGAAERRWATDGSATAYRRAQERTGQPAGGPQDPARPAAAARTAVPQRNWSADPDSPYGRAQAAAGARSSNVQGTAVARPRSSDSGAASSSRPLPSAPGRVRSTDDSASRASLGSAVPRSAPSRPSESRSPYYYLGPSERPQTPPATQAPSGAPQARPGAPQARPDRGGRGGAAEPGSNRGESRSYSSAASTWPASPAVRTPATGAAVPRSRSYSSPYPSAPGARYRSSAPSSAAPYSTPSPRQYSPPPRSAQPRPSPSWSSPPAGGPARSPGGYAGSSRGPAFTAPAGPPAGFSGGRSPGRGPGAPAGGGGGRGGSASGGGPARGGR